jgi:hypothetical protein
MVDMTAEREMLSVVITGRSIEVPIEVQERGSFSIPIGVLFKVKRISVTYGDSKLRIRITEGKFRLQGMSISNSGIRPRNIARRVIDIPADATARDLLSLPLIFSVDEMEDCGLHAKVLEAQKKMADDLESAYRTLCEYGFERNELIAMAKRKVASNAAETKRAMFTPEEG